MFKECCPKNLSFCFSVSGHGSRLTRDKDYLNSADYDRAETCFRNVLFRNPDEKSNVEAYLGLADVKRMRIRYRSGLPGSDTGKSSFESCRPFLEKASMLLENSDLAPEERRKSLLHLGYFGFEAENFSIAYKAFLEVSSMSASGQDKWEPRIMTAKCLAYMWKKSKQKDKQK
ncbi:MAG: tetratricopeptide repeat protein [Candidatus Eremiobacteraeota bacterium]|nr:tetratricopeptide repeat protein [Candidatus Eremiobacteraeota bacterium]